jgi:hypothetical protein
MMRPAYAITIMTLTALLGSFTDSAFGAAAGKGGSSERRKSAEHMSGKGRVNTNAQWSADPDRGWVRAEERHKLREKSDWSDRVKQNSRQQKGKGRKS